MRIKTTYIAIDGEEFETEEECLEHEASFVVMSEFVQFFDENFSPVEWNPENYDSMLDHIYYIIIKPHHEEEVEEWWAKSFGAMLGVDPFAEMGNDWETWKRHYHGNKPTVLALNFAGNESWILLNGVYDEVKGIVRGLDLVDALS